MAREARRRGGAGTRKNANREKVCPNRCAAGYADHQSAVTTEKVEMTPDQVAEAYLQPGAQLYRCRHCGCVWEKYRNALGDWDKRKIGTYDGPGPERGFVLYRNPRDH